MAYRPRPGVALITLCGAKALVPTRQLAAVCSRIRPLSFVDVLIWRGLENGLSDEKLRKVCKMFLRKSDEETTAYIGKTVRTLFNDGFLIEVPDGDEKKDGA